MQRYKVWVTLEVSTSVNHKCHERVYVTDVDLSDIERKMQNILEKEFDGGERYALDSFRITKIEETDLMIMKD